MAKSKSLKIFLLLIFIALCAMRYLPAGRHGAICDLYAQDKIVAIVNNDVITQKDLGDFINFMRMQLMTQYKGKALEDEIQSMRLDLLDRLIEDSLILQEAKKSNIRIDEHKIKERMEEVKKRYPSDIEFQKALSQQGLVQADLEKKIQDQMLMYAILEVKVRSKITVNPAEVTDLYQKNKDEFRSTEQRKLHTLSFREGDLANEILADFKKSRGLNAIAKKYSLEINEITAIRQGEFKKEVEDTIFKLKESEISEPIKVGEVYYIFKLNKIILTEQLNLVDVQDKIYSLLFEEKMQRELVNWLDELKENSYIKIFQN